MPDRFCSLRLPKKRPPSGRQKVLTGCPHPRPVDWKSANADWVCARCPSCREFRRTLVARDQISAHGEVT
eukprot:9457102-Lingulodinium_polyedra.AAC.1